MNTHNTFDKPNTVQPAAFTAGKTQRRYLGVRSAGEVGGRRHIELIEKDTVMNLLVDPLAALRRRPRSPAPPCPRSPPTRCAVASRSSDCRASTRCSIRMSNDGRIGGIVALVLRDGKPVYQRAVGWRDKEAGQQDDHGHGIPHRLAVEGADQRRHPAAHGGRQAHGQRQRRQMDPDVREDQRAHARENRARAGP